MEAKSATATDDDASPASSKTSPVEEGDTPQKRTLGEKPPRMEGEGGGGGEQDEDAPSLPSPITAQSVHPFRSGIEGVDDEYDSTPDTRQRRAIIIDADLEHVPLSRVNSLMVSMQQPEEHAVLASVITGKTVKQIRKGTLQATYYDGTLIAGAARKKNVLDSSTFRESNAAEEQQESFDIAPILGGDTPDDELQPEKFGTWDGVWARCMANIFGVIMFLRTGWIVGQAGIGLACLIILLSGFITTLTTMSMSAIATNGQVKGGGAYFLISRSVGPALGGAIGVLFTLGLLLGVALYTIGFCETMVSQLGLPTNDGICLPCYGAESANANTTCCNDCTAVQDAYRAMDWAFDSADFVQCSGVPIVVPDQPEEIFSFGDLSYVNNVRIWGVIVNTILLIMILIGIGWVVRLQAIFLGLIILSMVSVIIGAAIGPESLGHSANYFPELAPGFTGLGFPNGTCLNFTADAEAAANASTTCESFANWTLYLPSENVSLNCSNATQACATYPDVPVVGVFNDTQYVAAQDACCECGGGSTLDVLAEFCVEWVTNMYANLGPGFTCDGPSDNFYNGSPGECWNFWTVFAIFFPAVTGIMAGANISNLLKKPEKDLPVSECVSECLGGCVGTWRIG